MNNDEEGTFLFSVHFSNRIFLRKCIVIFLAVPGELKSIIVPRYFGL